jgi:hypothetical protein
MLSEESDYIIRLQENCHSVTLSFPIIPRSSCGEKEDRGPEDGRFLLTAPTGSGWAPFSHPPPLGTNDQLRCSMPA